MSPDPVPYADFLCALAAGFFAAASFDAFLPAIGISISFCPDDALRGFFAPFSARALVSANAPRRRLRLRPPARQSNPTGRRKKTHQRSRLARRGPC
jgi:hypothetical protein